VKPKLRKTASPKLEEVLVSKSRIKILKALTMRGPLNISEIKRCTGLNYKSIVKALKALNCMGLVGETDYHRTRSFRMKTENAEASAVSELLERLYALQRDPQISEERRSGMRNVSNPPHRRNSARLPIRYKELRESSSMVE
jgi:DNA-binding MarR family transcriptional regulator